jgi:phosphohistidine phosphatase
MTTTVRTLAILRHAKAEHPPTGSDADRSLTSRGHADAGAAGAWLAAEGYLPDLVICSPSRRTRQTWHAVAIAMGEGHSPEVRYEPAVYDQDSDDLLELVQTTSDKVGSVLLIGHNPSVSELSELLDPSAMPGDGLRTGGIAVHQAAKWSGYGPGTAPRIAAHTARG